MLKGMLANSLAIEPQREVMMRTLFQKIVNKVHPTFLKILSFLFIQITFEVASTYLNHFAFSQTAKSRQTKWKERLLEGPKKYHN